MKRPHVLLAYGGESTEHEVSLASGKNIYTAIDKAAYDVTLCYIDTDGRWWLFEDWVASPDDARQTQLVVAPGTGTLLAVPGGKVIPVDVIFPALHGKMGEDGTIQGLAAMAHIPIVGCSVESSAVCMNKDMTKRLLQSEDIPVVPWVVVREGDNSKAYRDKVLTISEYGPWFVKPSRAGSSIGVSKVTDISTLESAVATALSHDSIALIEAAVIGRELEVAVLGKPPHHEVSGVGEIFPGSDFYDYEDKYSADSSSRTTVKADLPEKVSERIREYALRTYETLGCSGLARVDFLLSQDMTPYVNEINTLPGFTDISMYPKLWQEHALSSQDLVARLIDMTLKV